MKINFTQSHFDRMSNLLLNMLLYNNTIENKLGMPLNAVELLHTTTVNTLNGIRLSLAKKIEKLESQDEWVSTDEVQDELDYLKMCKELVNLIIGYKRHLAEGAEIAKKKQELKDKIAQMKEEAKKRLSELRKGRVFCPNRTPDIQQKINDSLSKEIEVFDTNGNLIGAFKNAKELSNKLDIPVTSIRNCIYRGNLYKKKYKINYSK